MARVHVIESTSDPSAAPDFVGQHWINTTSSVQWLAKGTSTVGDWEEIGSGGGTPGGSDTEVQFNDGGVFAGDSNLIWDKTSDSLNIQTTKKEHPLHVNAGTGTTIPDVVTGSISQVAESFNASPTGSITKIASFPACTGSTVFQDTSSGNYTASNQVITYRIFRAILDSASGIFYRSNDYEEIIFTDTLGDFTPFFVIITFGESASANQTHWIIDKDVNGSGFNWSAITSSFNTTFDDNDFTNYDASSNWPTLYSIVANTPNTPTGLYDNAIDITFGNLTANGTTYDWEVRSATNYNGLDWVETTGAADSFTDANDSQTFNLELAWDGVGADNYIVRVSTDGGSNWEYQSTSASNVFVWSGQGNDSAAEASWTRDFSGIQRQYGFRCYGITTSPSLNPVYSSTATTYFTTIDIPNTYYIFLHNFTGMPSPGGKLLADYEAGVTNGKVLGNVSSFLDVGYTSWSDGTAISPTVYGFSGTAQVREYKAYSFNSTSGIYSPIPLTLSTSNTGGIKYTSGSVTYPSGVTSIKITRGINGAAHSSSKTLSSPTTAFTEDATDTSWSGNTTVTPTVLVPTTARFDLQRSTINQSTDNIAIVETSGSGDRFPSIVFGLAPDTNSNISLRLARIGSNSTSGSFDIGSTAGLKVYASNAMAVQLAAIGGPSNQLNMAKSSSAHTTIWAGDVTHPAMYAYSVGASNTGTIYFGTNNTSFGATSKVVISPSVGSVISLHFRHAAGSESTDAILIDEGGSFKGGWAKGGRLRLNAAGTSTTTWLQIGAAASGSQIRLAAGTIGVVEGDISNSSSQKCLTAFVAGIQQYDARNLFAQTATGTVANSTTETAISSTGVGTLVLPANFFVAGKTIRLKAFGIISSISSPNINIRFKFGSTTLCSTGNIASGNATNDTWTCEVVVTCRTTGGGGTVFSQGYFKEFHGSGSRGDMSNTAANSISTTASHTVSLTAQWGTASASNTISCTNLTLEVLH